MMTGADRVRQHVTPHLTAVGGLLVLLALAGCGREAAVDPGRGQPGFGLQLAYPTGQPWEQALSAALQDTTHVWLYRLGSTEQDARTVRPDPESGDSAPTQTAAITDATEVILEIPSDDDESWWRAFVRRGSLEGFTTFRLSPFDAQHTTEIVLSGQIQVPYWVAAYAAVTPLPAHSPPAVAPSASDVSAGPLLFPIAIGNSSPIDGLELRFRLAYGDSASLYVDPGSRLCASGASDDFILRVEATGAPGAAQNAFVLLIYPRIEGQQGAEIPAGTDLLFYLSAFGETTPGGSCIEQESAFFSREHGEISEPAAVYNYGGCN